VRAISSRIVTVRGQQLRVEVRPGNGNGTPLVLCSGIGISYQVFDRLIEVLDPGTEIIRFDVPGVGGSPVRAWPYGFPELAQLLAGLLTARDEKLPFYASLYPRGAIEGNWWRLAAHCPRCRSEWKSIGRGLCAVCSYEGHPAPDKKRRA